MLIATAALFGVEFLALSSSPASTKEMQTELSRYFNAEKRGGFVLLGMGGASSVVGGVLLAKGDELARGAAYPLLGLGAVELIGGIVFAARTDRQVRTLEHNFRLMPEAARKAELSRMERVNKQFRLLEVTEMALLFAGVGMLAAGSFSGKDTVAGVGLGIGLQSASLLVFDLFAAHRALRYTHALSRFTPTTLQGGML